MTGLRDTGNPPLTEPSKLAIALAVMAAMREYRKGKPIAFQPRTRP